MSLITERFSPNTIKAKENDPLFTTLLMHHLLLLKSMDYPLSKYYENWLEAMQNNRATAPQPAFEITAALGWVTHALEHTHKFVETFPQEPTFIYLVDDELVNNFLEANVAEIIRVANLAQQTKAISPAGSSPAYTYTYELTTIPFTRTTEKRVIKLWCTSSQIH